MEERNDFYNTDINWNKNNVCTHFLTGDLAIGNQMVYLTAAPWRKVSILSLCCNLFCVFEEGKKEQFRQQWYRMEKKRITGHPGLNWRNRDLQSNSLPLSCIIENPFNFVHVWWFFFVFTKKGECKDSYNTDIKWIKKLQGWPVF